MNKLELRKTYRNWVARIAGAHDRDTAMRMAIGGEFNAFGVLERELLIQYGLGRDDYVIDVGCGSGRLAKPLAAYLRGPYLGTDILPELLDYARSLVGRNDWRFETTEGFAIPEQDARADIVCFFSVFTHILHEQSYAYLRDARRVLKPGGRVVFSFLEFPIENHWRVFEGAVNDIGGHEHLNIFIGRDAITAWAEHLDLDIVAIHDGDKPHTPLPHPITLDDGSVMEGMGNLGQSVAVLKKR